MSSVFFAKNLIIEEYTTPPGKSQPAILTPVGKKGKVWLLPLAKARNICYTIIVCQRKRMFSRGYFRNKHPGGCPICPKILSVNPSR
ncbi:hypothetical protein HMPREF1545_01684 [Oscillibacter sp. KLE 1728]|nr:hypothetical protein HMPREF1545_01684 [Oscillibacter sp. KLE 1728]